MCILFEEVRLLFQLFIKLLYLTLRFFFLHPITCSFNIMIDNRNDSLSCIKLTESIVLVTDDMNYSD